MLTKEICIQCRNALAARLYDYSKWQSGNSIWRWTQDAEREWHKGIVECGLRPNHGVIITQITEPPPPECRMRLEQLMAGDRSC
jgi:hypothetical protein